MYFAFNLGAFLFAVGLARNGLSQTPPNPTPDVSAIFGALIPQINALVTATASFASGGNPGTLTQALGVYSTGRTLIAGVNTATNSIQALPQVPDEIGTPIYNQFSVIVPIIVQGFDDLNSKKNAFNALLPGSLAVPLGDPQYIISINLQALKSSVGGFVAAALVVAPPDILPKVQALAGKVEAAIDNAIMVYSS